MGGALRNRFFPSPQGEGRVREGVRALQAVLFQFGIEQLAVNA
jgi:hypothetical protein